MVFMKLFTGLGPLDARSIGRDSLLRWMLALPLLIVVPVRLVLPPLLVRIGLTFWVDLQLFYPGIASAVLLLITPALYGLVIGFLLLDQRDDQTLTALQITPLPVEHYLAYRLSAPTLLSYGMAVAAVLLAGLPNPHIWGLLLAGLVAALHTPLVALGLACFAANKVQGLALMKAGSVLLAAPLVGLFVPSSWRYVFGVLPTYWPATLYRQFQVGDQLAWGGLVFALSYQALLLAILLRRFRAVVLR